MNPDKCPAAHREVLSEYGRHLTSTCGLAAGSVEQRIWCVSRFLGAKYGESAPDFESLTPQDVARYVTGLPKEWENYTRKMMVSSLRSFLRWLDLCGCSDSLLGDSVPTVSSMRHSGIPAHITPVQLSALMKAFDLDTAVGLRGYAAAMCMSRLGMRVGEVARLTLDDIDWRSGTVRLMKTKGRRERVLPLPHAVGRALVEYLRKGRPKTGDRHVFINHRPSERKPPHTGALRADVRHAFRRAGVGGSAGGTRVLRHTAATNMLRGGSTMKEIADVLGHQHIDTTCIYAKVDIPALAELAAPWPKEVPA